MSRFQPAGRKISQDELSQFQPAGRKISQDELSQFQPAGRKRSQKFKLRCRCRLCDQSGVTKWVTYSMRSAHMRRYHLPDEPCDKCGDMVRPINLHIHKTKLCRTLDPSTVIDHGKEKVSCPECGRWVSLQNISRHTRANCLKNKK